MIAISVIIPTFNRKNRLRQALQSVLSQQSKKWEGPQTLLPFEILVVDDGSTDGTKALIEREFPQAAYFYQDNQGPAAARNSGIERSRGEWIAFLDSDDEWRPGKLKAQLDFFARNPDYRICQTEEIWIRNGRRVNPMKKHQKYGGWIFEKCLQLCMISPSAVMIHRSLFEEVGLFDESLPACEDYDLWLRIAAKFPVGLIDKPYVIKYGGHADQRSREFPAMDQFRIRSLIKIISSGTLTPEQEKTAHEMLELKAGIYLQGAIKRGKEKEIAKFNVMLSEAHIFGEELPVLPEKYSRKRRAVKHLKTGIASLSPSLTARPPDLRSDRIGDRAGGTAFARNDNEPQTVPGTVPGTDETLSAQ